MSAPTILVVEDDQVNREPLATAAGCDAFLNKPINRQMLLDTVARFIA